MHCNRPRCYVDKLCETFQVTSEWKKEVNIFHFKSPLEICFVPLKNENVTMKLSWIFSFSSISIALFFFFFYTGMCIFIKNCPTVLHKYLGTDNNTTDCRFLNKREKIIFVLIARNNSISLFFSESFEHEL